jgi:putative membrane protein
MPIQAKAAQPESSAKLDLSGVKTVQQFGTQVIGRADLSRAVSEIAVKKARQADAKEFAGFELMEANTVIAVLKDLGTPVPEMGPDAKAAFNLIANASEGNAFDKAYISAQYENHAFLRDLAAAYLKNSDANTADGDERHGRQLAKVALFAFTEHAAITHRIARELAA